MSKINNIKVYLNTSGQWQLVEEAGTGSWTKTGNEIILDEPKHDGKQLHVEQVYVITATELLPYVNMTYREKIKHDNMKIGLRFVQPS